MTRRLHLLILVLLATLVVVPVATASEKSVVAALQSTVKPIQRSSTLATRCPKAKDPVACIRKVGPMLTAAARNADRKIGAALDGTERRCFAAAIATYRKGLRRMAAGGVLLSKGRLQAGAKALNEAAAIMQRAARGLGRCR